MVVLGENIHQWELSDGNVIGVTRLEIKDLMTSFSEFSEPILQIGSKSSILDKRGGKWRNLYREKTFVGIDIESGENVDCVFDISDNILEYLSGSPQSGCCAALSFCQLLGVQEFPIEKNYE